MKEMPEAASLLLKELGLSLLEFVQDTLGKIDDSIEAKVVAAIALWRKVHAYLPDTLALGKDTKDKYEFIGVTEEATA